MLVPVKLKYWRMHLPSFSLFFTAMCSFWTHGWSLWKLYLNPEGNIQTSGNHLELWPMRYHLKVIQVAKFGLQTVLPIIRIKTRYLLSPSWVTYCCVLCARTLCGQFSPSTFVWVPDIEFGSQSLHRKPYDHEYLFISVLRVFSFSGILLINFPTFLRSLKYAVLGNNWVKMVLSDPCKDPTLSFVLKISFLLCLFSSVLKVFCFLKTQLDVARR